MADEEYREAEELLEVLEEVQHLGLDGDVEGGGRLVADEEPGPGREGPGDRDALALTARELVWIPDRRARPEPDLLEEVRDYPPCCG